METLSQKTLNLSTPKTVNKINGLRLQARPPPIDRGRYRGDTLSRRVSNFWENLGILLFQLILPPPPLATSASLCYNGRMDGIANLPEESNGRNAVAKLSYMHEGILNWLLQNPHKSLRECADEHGISQGWLSQLIHSDIFQAKLKERQESVFVEIAQDIPTKLRGVADQALEKVSQILEKTEDTAVVVDIFDKALNRLGYAPQKGGAQPAAPTNQQNNIFVASKEDLAAARQFLTGPAPTMESSVGVQNSNEGNGGRVLEHAPTISEKG